MRKKKLSRADGGEVGHRVLHQVDRDVRLGHQHAAVAAAAIHFFACLLRLSVRQVVGKVKSLQVSGSFVQELDDIVEALEEASGDLD